MNRTRGIVCGGHRKTVEAGIEILGAGGNAFDAAVACLLASFVTEPLMSSAAGGGFMTAHTSNHKSFAFDFFCQTPSEKRPEDEIEFFPIEVDFGMTTEEFTIGMGTTAVPGSIAGLFDIHQKLCSLPLSILAEPALHFAKNGVAVDSFQRHDFELLTPIIQGNSDYKPLFFPEDKLIDVGDNLALADMADFLEVLIKEGRDFFYKGEISREILSLSNSHGGHLDQIDFHNYQVEIRDPLEFRYKDHLIITNPQPSRGGSIMALMMSLNAQAPLESEPFSDQGLLRSLEILIKAEKIQKSKPQFQRFLDNLRGNSSELFSPKYHRASKWGSTTHFNVLDQHGNAASLSTTNGEGNGHTIPGTLIPLNNMLGEEALFPDGLNSWLANQRISSMMAPSLVLDSNGSVVIALGSGGAGRIPSSMMLTLHYLLDHQMPLEEAVHAPRLFWKEGVLNLEPGFDRESKLVPQVEEAIWWDHLDMFFGGVHSIQVHDSHFEGAGDSRRNGAFDRID